MEKTCEFCGEVYVRKPKVGDARWAKQRFCSRPCICRAMARDRPKPERTIAPCSRCQRTSDRLRRGLCPSCYSGQYYLYNRERSQEWYRENREHALAVRRAWRERNPDYFKQARFREAALQRATDKYHGSRAIRDAALARDNHQCQECGATERLHVHHVDGNRENRVLDNLLTLCASCHARLHAAQGDLALRPSSP